MIFFLGSMSFSQFGSDLYVWSIALAAILAGIFFLFGIFDKAGKDKKAESDAADDRLINLLRGEVEALSRKVEEQSRTIQDLDTRLNHVTTENATLRDIAQGRDPEVLNRLTALEELGNTNAQALTRLVLLLEATLKSQGIIVPDVPSKVSRKTKS